MSSKSPKSLYRDANCELKEFNDVGCTIQMHRHDHDTVHNTFVGCGLFEMNGKEYGPGALVIWPVGCDHYITAKLPGSRLMQIKRGKA